MPRRMKLFRKNSKCKDMNQEGVWPTPGPERKLKGSGRYGVRGADNKEEVRDTGGPESARSYRP